MLAWVAPGQWQFGPWCLEPRGRGQFGQLAGYWVAVSNEDRFWGATLGEVLRECRRRLRCPVSLA